MIRNVLLYLTSCRTTLGQDLLWLHQSCLLAFLYTPKGPRDNFQVSGNSCIKIRTSVLAAVIISSDNCSSDQFIGEGGGMRWLLPDFDQMLLTTVYSSNTHNLGEEDTACLMEVAFGSRVNQSQWPWEAGFVVTNG